MATSDEGGHVALAAAAAVSSGATNYAFVNSILKDAHRGRQQRSQGRTKQFMLDFSSSRLYLKPSVKSVEGGEEGADAELEGNAQLSICIRERGGHAIGSVVWGGSLALSRALMNSIDQTHTFFNLIEDHSNTLVIELGAGLGLVSIVIDLMRERQQEKRKDKAKNRFLTVATEMADMLPLLRENVISNRGGRGDYIEVAELSWGNEMHAETLLAMAQQDGEPLLSIILLGADILYSAKCVQPLLATVDYFSRLDICKKFEFWLSYKKRDSEAEMQFFDALGVAATSGGGGDNTTSANKTLLNCGKSFRMSTVRPTDDDGNTVFIIKRE